MPEHRFANSTEGADTVKSERIIDRDFLPIEASLAGNAERYAHGTTPHTLNVWWARRPHSAMRLVVYAALAAPSEAFPAATVAGIMNEDCDLQPFRSQLMAQYKRAPRLLDLFGGGGTTALAAARLGCSVESSDINELATFVQRTALVYPRAFSDTTELANAVQSTGEEILAKLKVATRRIFPLRDNGVTNYVWTHRQQCTHCTTTFALTRRTGIRKRGKKPPINLSIHNGENSQWVAPGAEGEDASANNWHDRRGNVRCPSCGTLQRARITPDSDYCCALIESGAGRHKTYYSPDTFSPTAPVDAAACRRRIRKLTKQLACPLPHSSLRQWSGVVNPSLYGMDTYEELFNPRQTCVFLELSVIFQKAFDDYTEAHGCVRATAVFALLACLFDQLIDWNCRLSMWIPQNEQVGRAFCGPGVSMIWDYCETDPCGIGPTNLNAKLIRIVRGTRALSDQTGEVNVARCSAHHLPHADHSFDAVVTDPPYYDNIYYAALADFFYSWKRIPLRRIFPDDFGPPLTSAGDEIVCSTFRDGANAHSRYIQILAAALREAKRVLRPDGRLALVFGHASLSGWVALIEAYQSAGLSVSAVEPLGIERKQRPRAIRSNAVNTCIVFVSRKDAALQTPLESLAATLQTIAEDNLAESLIQLGWPEKDAAMARFARSVAALINCPEVSGLRQYLKAISTELSQNYPAFKLTHR